MDWLSELGKLQSKIVTLSEAALLQAADAKVSERQSAMLRKVRSDLVTVDEILKQTTEKVKNGNR